VRAFQRERGLRVDGVCGPQTWGALVEAGYLLGDRLLYRRTPMLRGDDVAELQRLLGSLGFDAGRVDGIFGDTTAGALRDFQRNVGLTVDGIFGASTMSELMRLRSRDDSPEPVALVRERDQLRRLPRTLGGRRIAVGESGGLAAAVSSVARSLGAAGAEVVTLQHSDGWRLAEEANNAKVDVYIGLELDLVAARCTCSFYSGYRYESPGGRRLAEMLQAVLPRALEVEDGGAHGMSIPVLRQTKMTAVVAEIGPPSLVVEKAPVLAAALRQVLAEWAGASWE
jgi:N-acetylmuramoyl-L-alanine amidase